MSGAHTSGPWRTADGDAILAGHDGGLTVVGSIERPEDAALAAAAPELLEALEAVAMVYKRDNPVRTADVHDPSCTCMRCAIDFTDAAITKARGDA